MGRLTLILLTSDHETGGVTLPRDTETRDLQRTPVLTYSTGSHTGALVPIFANGPDADRFGGLLENWEVGQHLIELVRSRSRE